MRQYRPPVGAFVIEVPAGLLEKGEPPEEAALRELEEETGFVAQREDIIPLCGGNACYFSAAVSNSSSCVVRALVNSESEKNKKRQLHLEADEIVTDIFQVPLDELESFLKGLFFTPILHFMYCLFF